MNNSAVRKVCDMDVDFTREFQLSLIFIEESFQNYRFGLITLFQGIALPKGQSTLPVVLSKTRIEFIQQFFLCDLGGLPSVQKA